MCAVNPRVYLRNRPYRVSECSTAIPPMRFLMAVAGSAEIAIFLQGGQLARDSIRDILQSNGVCISDFRTILDFGCGCGRVL
jgi:hypothetical protein